MLAGRLAFLGAFLDVEVVAECGPPVALRVDEKPLEAHLPGNTGGDHALAEPDGQGWIDAAGGGR